MSRIALDLSLLAARPQGVLYPTRGIVASRLSLPMSQTSRAGDGTSTEVQEQSMFRLAMDASNVSVVWQNLSAQTTDEKGDIAFDIKARIFSNPSSGSGSYIQQGDITWAAGTEGGYRSPVLNPGDLLESDSGSFFGSKGDRVVVRRMVRTTGAAFPTWRASEVPLFDGDETNAKGAALTDGSGKVAYVYDSDAYGHVYSRGLSDVHQHFAPSMIIGTATSRVARIARLGDSIDSGTGDTNGGENASGWLTRLLTNNYPQLHIGQGGYSLTSFTADATKRAQRMAGFTLGGITHVTALIGTNDMNTGGMTAATFLANLAALKAILDAMNIRLIPVTIPPRTNSGNTATALSTREAERISANASLRAANGVGYGYIDFAAAAQDAVTPALWRTDTGTNGANGTGDGVHPNTALHQNIVCDYQAALLPAPLATVLSVAHLG